MKKILLKILRPIKYRMFTKKLTKPYVRYIEKNLASNGIATSREKMRSNIMMQAHILEKGLSLADVKPWFGQPKIASLIKDTKDYYTKYGDKKLLYWVVSMLQAYVDFNAKKEGAPNKIINQFELLKALRGDFDDESLRGGFIEVNREENQQDVFDFEKFALSRHSVRCFTGEPVNEQLIRRALKIAETTPSACNRQPWYNYVVTDKKIIEDVLAVQKGSRQFKDQVGAIIITASSAHFFFGEEYNQMFFNTGLYAMNLLYALHSEGLGTIPLNTGIGFEELDQIRSLCGIPESQMPISLIAVGILPKHYKYAKSARFGYEEYTKIVR